MSKVTKMELHPHNGRKSFNGKAVVVSNGKDVVLFSYDTPVCWASVVLFRYDTPVRWANVGLVLHRTCVGRTSKTGEHVGLVLHRAWGGWTSKTGEHVGSFCDEFGIPYKGKRDWDRMAVEAVPKWVKDKCVV